MVRPSRPTRCGSTPRLVGLAALSTLALLLVSGHPASGQNPVGVCVDPRGCGVSSSGPPGPPLPPPPPDPRMFWIGAAARVTGDVTFIYPTGQRVSGDEAARTPIPLGATVVTGPGGKVVILLIDETSFTIGPSSELVMDRFVYDPSTSTPTVISVKIIKGLFRFVTGKVARRDPLSMQVKTPVGTIGIRGTDFEIVADPDGSGSVVLHEGTIEFSSFEGDRTLTMRPGQRMRWRNFGDPVLE